MRLGWIAVQSIILTAVFILPYWLFDGKLSIGGDDGRLYFIFSQFWIDNLAWFSWFNFSSIGLHNPQQFIVPIVSIFALLNKLLPQLVVSNLAFSLPLVLGIIFFQKMIQAIFWRENESNALNLAALLGGLFYIFSPILWTISIAPFLYAVWLLALLPILSYYFLKYLQSGRWSYVLKGALAGVVLSLGFMAVPWFLGAIIPMVISLFICAKLFQRRELIKFTKRLAFYLTVLVVAQCFWLIPFGMSMLDTTGSYVGSTLSAATQDTFRPTVVATMSQNNIVYPLLNLFHRSIVFDFNWQIKKAFEQVYDNTYAINLIYVGIVSLAVLLGRQFADISEKRNFLIFAVALVSALFLFTVNIGPLMEVFLMLGNIPGMGMFRNAFDKFAIGFVYIYSILISISIWIILKYVPASYKRHLGVLIIFFVMTLLINVIPIKTLVNQPLWTTNNVFTTIRLSDEYSHFIEKVRQHTLKTSNVLSIPFAFPSYSIIKDESSNNVYIGASPLKILTGINDFSGSLSIYNEAEKQRLYRSVLSQNFAEFEQLLDEYNIGYVLVTNNIPRAVMNSYIFNGFPEQKKFNHQLQTWLRTKRLGFEVAKSETGMYSLYRIDRATSLFESQNAVFKKISPVKYKLSIRGLTKQQRLVFRDSFNLGWKLYLDKHTNLNECPMVADGLPGQIRECLRENHLVDWEDFSYFWRSNLSFARTSANNGINNEWSIDGQLIKDVGGGNYVQQPDGSIDVEMTLYFYPQLFFYVGIFISMMGLFVLTLLSFRQNRHSAIASKALNSNSIASV